MNLEYFGPWIKNEDEDLVFCSYKKYYKHLGAFGFFDLTTNYISIEYQDIGSVHFSIFFHGPIMQNLANAFKTLNIKNCQSYHANDYTWVGIPKSNYSSLESFKDYMDNFIIRVAKLEAFT